MEKRILLPEILIPLMVYSLIRETDKRWRSISINTSEVDFSHSLCPDCAEKLYPALKSNKENQ